MNKVLVSDYDQTFYVSDSDISENIKEADLFMQNNTFIIATGRSYQDLKNKQNKYKFKYNYLIINHGATILDEKDNIIFNVALPDNITPDLKEDLKLDLAKSYFCCSYLNSRVSFETKNLTKINVIYNKSNDMTKIYKYIIKKYPELNVYRIKDYELEIISNKTNKKEAIKYLAQNNYINSNIYTIGDGESDIEMIKYFKGYSMTVANPKVIAASLGSYKSVSNLIVDLKEGII